MSINRNINRLRIIILLSTLCKLYAQEETIEYEAQYSARKAISVWASIDSLDQIRARLIEISDFDFRQSRSTFEGISVDSSAFVRIELFIPANIAREKVPEDSLRKIQNEYCLKIKYNESANITYVRFRFDSTILAGERTFLRATVVPAILRNFSDGTIRLENAFEFKFTPSRAFLACKDTAYITFTSPGNSVDTDTTNTAKVGKPFYRRFPWRIGVPVPSSFYAATIMTKAMSKNNEYTGNFVQSLPIAISIVYSAYRLGENASLGLLSDRKIDDPYISDKYDILFLAASTLMFGFDIAEGGGLDYFGLLVLLR